MLKQKVNNEVKVLSGGKKELRFANKSAFPQTGNSEYVYIALDENKIYRYDTTTSTYVAIGGSGTEYTAGNGISISNNEIAIDSQVVETTTHASSTYQTQSGMSAYRTSANQDIIDNGKESTSNKVSSWQETTDNTHYPSEKLVKDSISAETSARESADSNLQTQIDGISAIGRELSGWNSITGLPVTNPQTLPYTYKTGDYYIVENVNYASYDTTHTYNTGDHAYYNEKNYTCNQDNVTGTWDSTKWTETTPTYYKPDGTQYTGSPSSVVETNSVKPLDLYKFDGTNWYLIARPQVDLSGYPTKAGNETITGGWTFTNRINIVDINADSNQNIVFSINNNARLRIDNANLYPHLTNQLNIGRNGNQIKDIWIAGKVKDYLTNSEASIYQLANGVLGMQAPSSTQLTDAEYAELTNGKPHQIIGEFLGYKNPLLLKGSTYGNTIRGTLIGAVNIVGSTNIDKYIIDTSTKIITKQNEYIELGYTNTVNIQKLTYVNGKQIPSYPSNTGYFEFAQSNGTLSWIDKSVVTITDTTYSGAFASAKTYNFTNAMTSLAISGFETQSGDLNPSWNLHLIAGANFTLTLPSGATWKYGTPTFTQGSEYTIQVEPRLTSGTYYLYLV